MRSPIFLQAGCSVAIEIERPAKQPARDLHAANGERQVPSRDLSLEGDDVLRALHASNVREALGFGLAIGNAITRAVHQESQ